MIRKVGDLSPKGHVDVLIDCESPNDLFGGTVVVEYDDASFRRKDAYLKRMMKQKRCEWCGDDPLYVKYHDEEWGRPVTDDRVMFEFLTLESAQAGLSWITILRKRENYRKAFAKFDPKKVAKFTEDDVERLMNDPGIVRNRLKIKAAISNARLFLDVQKEFGSFCDYLRSFLPDGKSVANRWKSCNDIPATSELSDRIAADMKRRGFKFFGSTICYAHLQATGIVNDHIESCPHRNRKEK